MRETIAFMPDIWVIFDLRAMLYVFILKRQEIGQFISFGGKDARFIRGGGFCRSVYSRWGSLVQFIRDREGPLVQFI